MNLLCAACAWIKMNELEVLTAAGEIEHCCNDKKKKKTRGFEGGGEK